MGLIPDRIIRTRLAYKIATIVAYALAMCCFFWDVYTHRSLEQTQEHLRQSLENQEYLIRIVQKECKDGN